MVVLDFDALSSQYAIVLLVNFLILAMSMLLILVWMARYGLQIFVRLKGMQSVRGQDRSIAFSAIRRVNIVVFFLGACALLRVFALIVLMIDILRHSHDQNNLGNILWFIFSGWIPSLGPSCTLLYITRRAGIGGVQAADSSVLSESKAFSTSITSGLLSSEYTTSSATAVMTAASGFSSEKSAPVH